jgi:hypothetical protein
LNPSECEKAEDTKLPDNNPKDAQSLDGDPFEMSRALCGMYSEYASAMALDADGNAISVGKVSSPDFPLLNPVQNNISTMSQFIGFVSKTAYNGTLLWSTYLGKNWIAEPTDVIIDHDGNVIVCRYEEGNPQVSGPYGNGLVRDAYITKYSPIGTLLWEKMYNLSEYDTFQGVAVDSTNNIIAVGSIGKYYNKSQCFMVKLNPSGDEMWNNSFGSTENDELMDVFVDSQNNYYACGYIGAANYSITTPLLDRLGNKDVLLVKVNSNGQIIQSTAFGGSEDDIAISLEINSANEIIIVGNTRSIDYPAVRTEYKGKGTNQHLDMCVFITKILGSWDLVLWSSYFGNAYGLNVAQVAVDNNKIFIIGTVWNWVNFPLIHSPYYGVTPQSSAPYIARISTAGFIDWAFFFPGCVDGHSGNAIQIDRNHKIWIAGTVRSDNFPITQNDTFSYKSTANIYIGRLNEPNVLSPMQPITFPDQTIQYGRKDVLKWWLPNVETCTWAIETTSDIEIRFKNYPYWMEEQISYSMKISNANISTPSKAVDPQGFFTYWYHSSLDTPDKVKSENQFRNITKDTVIRFNYTNRIDYNTGRCIERVWENSSITQNNSRLIIGMWLPNDYPYYHELGYAVRTYNFDESFEHSEFLFNVSKWNHGYNVTWDGFAYEYNVEYEKNLFGRDIWVTTRHIEYNDNFGGLNAYYGYDKETNLLMKYTFGEIIVHWVVVKIDYFQYNTEFTIKSSQYTFNGKTIKLDLGGSINNFSTIHIMGLVFCTILLQIGYINRRRFKNKIIK